MKTKSHETYQQAKSRHQSELNEFEGIFFAFSDKQFAEGMAKVGLAPDQTDKLYRLPGGGFILKSRNDAFKAMFLRHESESREARKSEKFLLESLVYELGNHEYCITYDHSDALDALGLSEEDLPAGMLKKAKRVYLSGCSA